VSAPYGFRVSVRRPIRMEGSTRGIPWASAIFGAHSHNRVSALLRFSSPAFQLSLVSALRLTCALTTVDSLLPQRLRLCHVSIRTHAMAAEMSSQQVTRALRMEVETQASEAPSRLVLVDLIENALTEGIEARKSHPSKLSLYIVFASRQSRGACCRFSLETVSRLHLQFSPPDRLEGP
jgi:hypothetical protein